MITRFARAGDIVAITELLKQFSAEARVGFRPWATDLDTPRVTRMVTHWQQHHYVRVCEHEDTVIGILIAEHGTDFWDPNRRLLQERAWYVAAKHRGTRAGALLWQAWDTDTAQYLAQGRVQAVLLSTQGPSTNFDPSRRGWNLIEQTWMKE